MTAHLDLLHRRAFFQRSGLGIGALALSSLLRDASATPENPLAQRQPHFAPKAKRVIFLHMIGAPSQLDLFDPKPELEKWQVARIATDTKAWTDKGKIVKLSPADQEEAVRRVSAAAQSVVGKSAPLKEFYDKLKAITASVN